MASALTFYPPRTIRVGGLLIAVTINGFWIWLLFNMPRPAARLLDDTPGTLVQILPAEPALEISKPIAGKQLPLAKARKVPLVVRPVAALAHKPATTPGQAITAEQPAADALPKSVLDMEALRTAVKTDMRHSQASMPQKLDLSVEPAAAPSAMAREMNKAVRQSCGSAHANALLLAPLLILKDTLTDSGCTLQP